MDPDSRNFQSSEDQGGPQPPAHRVHSSASTSRATLSRDESHLDDWEDGSCISFPEWDPYYTTEAAAQEAESRYDASYRGSTVDTTALFQEQAAAPIEEAREMGEEDSPVITPSFFDTFFEGLSHEYAENDKEKRVPGGDSRDTTESAGQNDESYYDAIIRSSTVGKTVLLLEEAAARISEGRGTAEGTSISSKATTSTATSSLRDTSEGQSDEYDVKQTEKGHARARRSTWPRPIPSGLDYDEEISTVPQWAKEMMGLTDQEDTSKSVPGGDSRDKTESAGQNDESYYDAIFRSSTVGKTVLLLEEAAARIAEGRGTAEGTSISSKATASTATSSLRDTSEGQSDEYDVKQTEKGHARARRSTWPRPIPSGLDYDEEISTVPQWAKEMMGLTDQEDTSKRDRRSHPTCNVGTQSQRTSLLRYALQNTLRRRVRHDFGADYSPEILLMLWRLSGDDDDDDDDEEHFDEFVQRLRTDRAALLAAL